MFSQGIDIEKIINFKSRLTLAAMPEGVDALVLGDLVRARASQGKGETAVFVARDDARAAVMGNALSFFAPDITQLQFPAWDCLPYDRVSPKSENLSRRMACLSALIHRQGRAGPLVVLTTVNALMQRVPPQGALAAASFHIRPGAVLDMESFMAFLTRGGYHRIGTVREPGEFAVRGGIIDVYAPGSSEPVRIDLFGDCVDSLRKFDPETQRTLGQLDHLNLDPVSEILLTEAAIALFRSRYVAAFGAVTTSDPLYEAVSAGQRFAGMEHWLPLFHDHLETFFDYLGAGALIAFDHLAEEAHQSRRELIQDYYQARTEGMNAPAAQTFATAPYKPLEPPDLYLTEKEWRHVNEAYPVRVFTPFQLPAAADVVDGGARVGHNFAAERAAQGENVFDAVAVHEAALRAKGKRTFIACWSAGSAERMAGVLSDHGLPGLNIVKDWHQALALPRSATGVIILGLEHGFETNDIAVIAEQDILGDRLVRSAAKSRKAADFIVEATQLSSRDLVVHVDHGIGRYEGLETVTVSGAAHDCLLLVYQGGDKLYLPVENIELLSRYGGENENAQLDRLGGAGWQGRKAKLKKRVREMAEELIRVAAARALRKADIFEPPHGIYEEFCARFPFEETEDQQRVIAEALEDLARGQPMDRLVCGDVGFGKTEVALRLAFVAAMSGRQVAIVTPTTLLCRQHFKTFSERFAGFPIEIRQLSRFVSSAQAAEVRAGLASGQVDIAIGTHALLAKSIAFRDLGLLVIDEEQHFGVVHKERLKQLKSNVHVLTLTATPIPRTLQLAMSGVRELSLIATPPVDRLAVRTYVTPFDPLVIREALLREHYRDGQSFYVCPRVADLEQAAAYLRDHVPEVKFTIAHGQMPPGQLDEVMNAFYDGQYDVLLSTTIVESGLDIPRANTLVVHRADMFGLAQLYQLRGRVGRSKARAYAYFTMRPGRTLTVNAEKRLQVLQSLDTLGAGFSLASHDLDIRGAGNLLGDEQSGHIREVGLELYQNMLEEAVAALREDGGDTQEDSQWSPQINLGTSVLIPGSYVPDLDLRLSLYRRLSTLTDKSEIDGFAAELIDRFGTLPQEVEHLFKIVEIKTLCRLAGVAKVDAGPKGATFAFRNDDFANPAGLIEYISQSASDTKLRPDHTLVVRKNWPAPEHKLKGVQHLLSLLAEIAAEAP